MHEEAPSQLTIFTVERALEELPELKMGLLGVTPALIDEVAADVAAERAVRATIPKTLKVTNPLVKKMKEAVDVLEVKGAYVSNDALTKAVNTLAADAKAGVESEQLLIAALDKFIHTMGGPVTAKNRLRNRVGSAVTIAVKVKKFFQTATVRTILASIITAYAANAIVLYTTVGVLSSTSSVVTLLHEFLITSVLGSSPGVVAFLTAGARKWNSVSGILNMSDAWVHFQSRFGFLSNPGAYLARHAVGAMIGNMSTSGVQSVRKIFVFLSLCSWWQLGFGIPTLIMIVILSKKYVGHLLKVAASTAAHHCQRGFWRATGKRNQTVNIRGGIVKVLRKRPPVAKPVAANAVKVTKKTKQGRKKKASAPPTQRRRTSSRVRKPVAKKKS